MHRRLSTLAALLVALAVGSPAQAACTAGNPNASLIETTPTSAFTDHGNGTVTHTLTGLMWKQCSQGQSGAGCASGSAQAMTWSTALQAAVADTTAGYTDWRLPNQKELESIVESCGYSPTINQTVFPATPASVYWPASSYRIPSFAWAVYFTDGDFYINPKSGYGHARLVRGGASLAPYDLLSPWLSVAKSQPTPAPTVGVNTTYTITVTNTDNAGVAATTATVVDVLPANVTFVSAVGSGFSCTHVSPSVTCTLTAGSIAKGATATIDVTVTPTSVATLTNYLAVGATGGNAPPAARTCTAQDTVVTPGDAPGCGAPVVTPMAAPLAGPVPVPTLSEWGMMLLAGLLALFALARVRRQAVARR
jgi:uncharacterized repeat protein (TIGR01451 family)